jgi:hypothetical protein
VERTYTTYTAPVSSGSSQVVEVHAAGREELRVLLAKNTVAQDAAGHVGPLVVDRIVATIGSE